MSQSLYTSLDEKPFASRYMFFHDVIDRPVEDVWSHAIHIGAWMNEHRLVTLAGTEGHQGHFERVYPQNLPPETPEPHYHLYGIAEVVAPHYIVLEVFSERGGSYGDESEKIGVDIIALSQREARSTNVGLFLVDLTVAQGNGAQTEAAVADVERETQLRIPRYFENLRQLANGQEERVSPK
jgi:hypothetical protein